MGTSIRLAFAVSNDAKFENTHFGEADKYLIYEMTRSNITFLFEHINAHKTTQIDKQHGLESKGKAISNCLLEHQVQVLVSRQFGPNIKLINQHFVPIKIAQETPEEAGGILHEYFNWIDDELTMKKSDFKLFTINQGILKTNIN